ncbi:MAG: glyoxalase/bleomycin resistance/dioxygenase family protein [Bacteroidetes bacterium]|nr:glyoxalase/bleomycin resistance/dioxygenase family protein [Bacteroidota bacterium]
MQIKEIVLILSGGKEVISKFYNEKLGFEIVKSSESLISFRAGRSLLTFKTDPEIKSAFYHFAFNIPSDQFTAAKNFISKSGIELITLDGDNEFNFVSWNAHSFYFHDPAGNIVEFISRHNLKNDSGQKFSKGSVIDISEIGLPADDVVSFCGELESESEFPPFTAVSPEFAALGNDNGLLIIVRNGRRWFPGCAPAKIFPVEIYAGSERGIKKIISKNNYKIMIE